MDIMRKADVANHWKTSRRTIERWVDAGKHLAPHRDPGGRPYWLRAEFEAYVASGVAPLTAEPSQPGLEPSLAAAISHGRRPRRPVVRA